MTLNEFEKLVEDCVEDCESKLKKTDARTRMGVYMMRNRLKDKLHIAAIGEDVANKVARGVLGNDWRREG